MVGAHQTGLLVKSRVMPRELPRIALLRAELAIAPDAAHRCSSGSSQVDRAAPVNRIVGRQSVVCYINSLGGMKSARSKALGKRAV
jgi:hypothetical protein